MSNPLSQVGQTPHPEATAQVQQQSAPAEPPATRLPQHPEQQPDESVPAPAGQPGEPKAEDKKLPHPTQAD